MNSLAYNSGRRNHRKHRNYKNKDFLMELESNLSSKTTMGKTRKWSLKAGGLFSQ
jgi:hypothetical protein